MHLALILLLSAAAGDKLVAVLEIRNKVATGEVDAGYLADTVRTAALDAGAKVMTRENMLVLLKSSGKKLEDCEGECEVDTGRRLGADLVVSGEVLKFGSKYKLDLRMHDTASGQLVSAAQASGKSLDDLDDAIGGAVKKLFAPFAQADRTAPAQSPAAAEGSAASQSAEERQREQSERQRAEAARRRELELEQAAAAGK